MFKKYNIVGATEKNNISMLGPVSKIEEIKINI